MALANIYLMEAANLFCGDHDPSGTNHLTLEEMKLPDLEQSGIEHAPGGGVMGMTFTTTMVKALSSTFKLKGMDPERLALFGLGSSQKRKFTAYGVVREKRTNKAMDAVAVMEGAIMRLSGTAFTRGNGMDHEYMIGELLSYHLAIDGKDIYKIDAWTNQFEVGGVSQTDELNRLLRIPGTA